jgi:hypothetical protein
MPWTLYLFYLRVPRLNYAIRSVYLHDPPHSDCSGSWVVRQQDKRAGDLLVVLRSIYLGHYGGQRHPQWGVEVFGRWYHGTKEYNLWEGVAEH